MRTEQTLVEVRTQGRGFLDVTAEIERVVRASGMTTGLCTVFLQHTSASLLIQENADPAVLRDLGRFLGDLAPESRSWEHDDEGPDDMPAHAKAALMRTSETIPITRGSLALGTWQALYVVEHRTKSHGRRLVVTVMGE